MSSTRELNVFVWCHSHRARNRVQRALGYKPVGYYSLRRDFVYGVFLVPPMILPIKGVTRLRYPDRYHLLPCWSALGSGIDSVQVQVTENAHACGNAPSGGRV